MTERDSQRSKLYKAERKALEPLKTELPTVGDVERYIHKQVKRVALQTRYGGALDLERWPLKITDGRGTRKALAHGSRKISLPAGWARCDWVALHEFAHIVHNRLGVVPLYGTRTKELEGGASHGWQFAAIYIDLVHFCMGAEAADALKAEFKAARVRWRPKQKRTASPAAIAALAEYRLKKAA